MDPSPQVLVTLSFDLLNHLRQLAQAGPVIIGAQPPKPVCQERQVLLDEVRKSASQVWEAQ